MCGRYTLHKKAEALASRYKLDPIPDDLRENYNVAPGHLMPIIVEEDGKQQLKMMKWGFVPVWAKDTKIGYKLINARDDTIFEKPMWRSAILKKRCIVPADGFYEWKRPKDTKEQKQPFYIHPAQQDIFSMAGVWSAWKDAEGRTLETYSIITTNPNKEMRAVHDRMPVILHKKDEADWLESSSVARVAVEPLLRPLEDGALTMHKVSVDVNSPKNNDEHLIYELDE